MKTCDGSRAGGPLGHKVRAFLTTPDAVVIGSACIVNGRNVAVSGRRYVIAQIDGGRLEHRYARLD